MMRYYYITCSFVVVFALAWLLRKQPMCRGLIRFTAKWSLVLAGIVAGAVFADWALYQNPRPAFCVFLQTPLFCFFSYIDHLRIIPHDSLAWLGIIVPFWFIYWACLGALVGLLFRLSFCLFWKLKHRDESQLKHP